MGLRAGRRGVQVLRLMGECLFSCLPLESANMVDLFAVIEEQNADGFNTEHLRPRNP
jgi:hypothetical protein